ncbi:MAG: M28 family peptidase [Marinilabiliaceae bacterium]|jgi:hypothetical protein|nr:M28 family peptidase [Marinilabiliaceae bacterium]
MKKLLLLLLISIPLLLSGQEKESDNKLLMAMHSISSHDLLEYVKIQCDDRFAGRLTGTEEFKECAKWLASFFDEIGLKPAGDNGSWYQWFDIPYTLIYPDCGVALHIPSGKKESVLKHYNYISEYMPGSTSGNGEITAEVVYAGYGITAPELGYDDYKNIKAEGKIILIEREVPVSPSAGAEIFNPWFEYSFHQYKLKNALKHGAAGMLYNYGPIANPNNAYDSNFIYVHVGDSVVKDIFAGSGKKHGETVNKIQKDLKPASFNTGKTVTIKMASEHFPDGKGMNIIGMIEGSDPVLKKELIIVGAHLDHMGRCYDIIPGANDNASAVAVMMGVAKALKEYDIDLKRSVMFLAFGSEEQGIIGAKTYIEDPLFDLEKTVLLNMDGVGTGHSIGITAGKDFPLLYKPFETANNKFVHRNLSPNNFPNLGRPRLDAARFLTAGVPSLSFYTFGTQSYYHVPLDNLDIIKPEIMEDMARLLLLSLADLANNENSIR